MKKENKFAMEILQIQLFHMKMIKTTFILSQTKENLLY